MSCHKNRIQIIGSFLDSVSKKLNNMGILTESMINGCSPLAMTGTFDQAYQKYSDMPDLKPHELLNIRKNLDKVLSHDPKNFSDNYNIQPRSKEVRLSNTSEYLIYMNSSIELPVLEKADMVYSEYTTEEIRNAIKNSEGGFTRRTFPFTGSFNWKYYYDRFIDIVLKEYDPDHIILIRSNCSRFYMSDHDVGVFEKLSGQFVGMMERIDNYFIERTHCLVVNEHCNNIPPKYVECWFPYIQMSADSAKAVAEEIYDIIVNKNTDAYKPHFYGYTSDFFKTLLSRLSKDIISHNAEHLKYIDDNMLNVDKLSKLQSGTCEFFDNIIKLRQFLDVENKYRLAEYAVDVQSKKITADIELVELYTRYFKLELNDIIAVYLLCSNCENAAEYKKIVSNILSNSDCISVNSARKFKEKNIAFLKEYPYISVKEFTEDNGDVYVPLVNNCWLVLNPNSETPIRKFEFNAKELDYKKIIADGYICSIDSADALTYSYDYYVEKARNKDGNKPTYLRFNSKQELVESLYFINYCDLLKNERFVFVIGDNKDPADINDFIPIMDLTELLDPDIVTVNIEAGLGDQLCNFVMGKIIEKYAHKKVIYDTTKCSAFNGFEVDKFAKEPMSLLTSKLSPRLTPIREYGNQLFKKIYLKLSEKYTYMTQSFNYVRYEKNAKGAPCYLCGENKKDFIEFKSPHMYYNLLLRIETLKQYYDFKLSDFIAFPPFESEQLISLADEMTSCDAIVMHVRRGDYVTAGVSVDNEYYKSTIQSVMKIDDYLNKKIFIFSDDIKWCKLNLEQLGIDKIEKDKLFFVDSNKGEESYRDIQLMALGKVIIASQSYFPTIAALYSDRWEVFVTSDKNRMNLFQQYVRKNKYDVRNFKEEAVIDINEKDAKEKAAASNMQSAAEPQNNAGGV